MTDKQKTELLALSKRKNAAYVRLMERRYNVYVPSTMSKSTSDDRKVALDYAARTEQETYDNLCDEYEIRMLAFSAPLT